MAVYILWLVALAFAHSPEQHTERVHINGFVVLLFHHFGRHIERSTNQRVIDETLGFTETQIS